MTNSHLIATAADAQQFVLGGRARFTLVSKQTGKRYTYRVSKAKDIDDMFFCQPAGRAEQLAGLRVHRLHQKRQRSDPGQEGQPQPPGIPWAGLGAASVLGRQDAGAARVLARGPLRPLRSGPDRSGIHRSGLRP